MGWGLSLGPNLFIYSAENCSSREPSIPTISSGSLGCSRCGTDQAPLVKGLLDGRPGPHWGHIRATTEQIAADNSGHHRAGTAAAHYAGSAKRHRWRWPRGLSDMEEVAPTAAPRSRLAYNARCGRERASAMGSRLERARAVVQACGIADAGRLGAPGRPRLCCRLLGQLGRAHAQGAASLAADSFGDTRVGVPRVAGLPASWPARRLYRWLGRSPSSGATGRRAES
jgi:hypothetical protein